MKVGKANIIQGHNQNALAHRQRVRMEARGGDLQIVPSWKKREDRTDTWKQKKEKGRSLVYYHSHAKFV